MAIATEEYCAHAARLSVHNRPARCCGRSSTTLLWVVEGVNDIRFLRRIVRLLRHVDPQVIDLSALEQQGRLAFLPQGGGSILANADRLALLGHLQLYLFDRENGPITAQRQRIAAVINNRTDAWALVTRKRALENYLHPDAVFDARKLSVEFTDDCDVATLVARRQWESASKSGPWSGLPHRVRHRQRSKAKLWLNTAAVEQMTVERLAERDPSWEILSWFTAVRDLL